MFVARAAKALHRPEVVDDRSRGQSARCATDRAVMVPCSATSSIAASRNRARMVRSSGGGVDERMFTIVYMCSGQQVLRQVCSPD